jgi:hypothetical protein
MTFWQAYKRSALIMLTALWWIAQISAVVAVIFWLASMHWYVLMVIAIAIALAATLALQAREMQRRSR